MKVLKNIATAIAGEREKRVVYNTNRMFKCLESFGYMKALSTSGKIHCNKKFHNLVRSLSTTCKLHVNTMYIRLTWMQDAGLITRDKKNNIVLTSYEKICERYGLKETEFYEINEETTDQHGRFEYVLKMMVLHENKQRQQFQVEKKLNNNPVLKQAFSQLLPKCESPKELCQVIDKYQVQSFVEGSRNYDVFHTLRVDTNPTNRSIARLFGFSAQSSTDLKQRLAKLEFIKIIERRHESKVCTRLPRHIVTGASIPLYFDWNNEKKTRVWVRCPQIEFLQCF